MKVIDLVNLYRMPNNRIEIRKNNWFLMETEKENIPNEIKEKIVKDFFTSDYKLVVNYFDDEIEPIEDEFIDIEELEIGHPEDNPSNKYIINEYGTKCFLTKHSRIMADKINDLIKNQKVLINKLKEEGK